MSVSLQTTIAADVYVCIPYCHRTNLYEEKRKVKNSTKINYISYALVRPHNSDTSVHTNALTYTQHIM